LICNDVPDLPHRATASSMASMHNSASGVIGSR